MLYLKNTLGGLSRSLTDSALNSFQGPNRWWKLALFAVLFVLPGGSVGVAVLAWIEHRRGRRNANAADLKQLPAPGAKSASHAALNTASQPAPAGGCQSRADAPCRAAAGKLARQTNVAETRV
ncbi:hypothetical protein AAGS40_00100 [Paraburkholderia sp. PREW-6R]|uniref:hypothetical protein n=1 Tax=Paraburkholderia sp. PREW-6R TaxID=3141544 RepID=UPI0031F4C069